LIAIGVVQPDVTSSASIQSVVLHTATNHDFLDVLISNAGITSLAQPLLSQLHETFETNTFGPAVLIEAMAGLLQKSREARVIFVSSELGSIGKRVDRNYMFGAIDAMVSKAALNMLAVCFAKSSESWETPAKIWCYDPGLVYQTLQVLKTGRTERS
jgi:NAD(P)-dependent dehydrogenase (short-subunit alcohol dehydrogenase family)